MRIARGLIIASPCDERSKGAGTVNRNPAPETGFVSPQLPTRRNLSPGALRAALEEQILPGGENLGEKAMRLRPDLKGLGTPVA